MRKKIFVLAFMLGFISANAQVVKNVQLSEIQSMDVANHNGHEYVDFGLPSGVLWATCNVGADSPEEEGERFAWGEIEPKSRGSLNNYKFYKSSTEKVGEFEIYYSGYTKYVVESTQEKDGYNGYYDNLTVLELEDDAAHCKWGDGWRIPTEKELNELYQLCKWTSVTYKGIAGYLVERNGKSIFIRSEGISEYWSSDIRTGYNNNSAQGLAFSGGKPYVGNYFYSRDLPCPIRPICKIIISTSIEFNKTAITLREGETETLAINFTPTDATNKNIVWTSSNTSVVTVNSNGVVSAVKPGISTVMAKTTDGSNLSASCVITVKDSGIEELVDGEPYTNTRRTTYDVVTFSKTFSSTNVGKWNALYVPISIDVTEHADDFDIAEIYAFCSTVDTNGDGTVDANDERFLFVRPLTSGQTYPNTPYLIRPREAKNYIIKSADNVLYEKRDGKVEFSTTRDKFVVTGLNEEFTVTANDNNYYVSGSGKLSIRTSGSTTVKPNRWIMHREDKEYSDIPDYIEDSNHLENEENAESGVKAYTIIAIGEDISESDAIIAVKNAHGEFVKGVYTLDGRKMNNSNNLRAGMYIKNGKKVIIK